MGLSNELQTGKAGEHLVCADLIIKGHNAFLADQGLPYDIIVDINNQLFRVQVKTTRKLINVLKHEQIYRFNTRRAKGNRIRYDIESVDYFAFVALDIMEIAYLPIKDMISRNNSIKQTVDFKSRYVKYTGRMYPNGTVRDPNLGKYFQDYKLFGVFNDK